MLNFSTTRSAQEKLAKGVIIEQLSRKKHNVALDFSLNPRTLPEGVRNPKIKILIEMRRFAPTRYSRSCACALLPNSSRENQTDLQNFDFLGSQ